MHAPGSFDPLATGGWSTLPDGIRTHYIKLPCSAALTGTQTRDISGLLKTLLVTGKAPGSSDP
jgi:hypothetical protein